MSGPHHSPWARPLAHDQHAGPAPHRHLAPPQGWPQDAAGPGPVTQRNTLGIVAVGLAGLGILLACVPGIMPLGWIVLLIAFVLSLVAVTSTHKRTGVAIAGVGDELGSTTLIGVSYVTEDGTVIHWYDHVAVVPHALNGELYPGGTATTPQIGSA